MERPGRGRRPVKGDFGSRRPRPSCGCMTGDARSPPGLSAPPGKEPHTCHLRPVPRGSGEISVHRKERPGPPQSPCPCSLASALSSQTGQSNIRVSIISWFSTCHRMMLGGKKGEAEGDADRQECTSFSWGGGVS